MAIIGQIKITIKSERTIEEYRNFTPEGVSILTNASGGRIRIANTNIRPKVNQLQANVSRVNTTLVSKSSVFIDVAWAILVSPTQSI